MARVLPFIFLFNETQHDTTLLLSTPIPPHFDALPSPPRRSRPRPPPYLPRHGFSPLPRSVVGAFFFFFFSFLTHPLLPPPSLTLTSRTSSSGHWVN